MHSAWVQEHVKKLKGADANGRRGSMFELLGGNLFRHAPQSIAPTKRNNPGYDFLLTMPDGATADLSLKSYGTSYHEATFRQEAAKTEQAFLSLLSSDTPIPVNNGDRIRNARLDRFTLDRMITILGKLDQEIEMSIRLAGLSAR